MDIFRLKNLFVNIVDEVKVLIDLIEEMFSFGPMKINILNHEVHLDSWRWKIAVN